MHNYLINIYFITILIIVIILLFLVMSIVYRRLIPFVRPRMGINSGGTGWVRV